MSELLQRLPDWQLRLDALVHERTRARFAWGSNDCALFAADAVHAVTGHDLAAGLRGLGARQALRHVQRVGGMCHLVPAALAPLTHTSLAQEGDIALVQQPGRGAKQLALGVVVGEYVIGPSSSGLMAAPMRNAVQVWGVGHG